MVNIKLGDKTYENVEAVKLDTPEGGTVEFAPYEETFAAGKAEGIEEGKKSEYDRFWDAYQQNGNKTTYYRAFANDHWDDVTYNPKYPIVCASKNYATQAFYGAAKLTTTKVSVSVIGSNANQMFCNCSKLIAIPSLYLSEGSAYDSMFAGCVALRNVQIDGVIAADISFNDSSLLTDASVQSILDHLKDLTGSEAQTLTFHANVGAKLTEAQKAAITAKNWTLVY